MYLLGQLKVTGTTVILLDYMDLQFCKVFKSEYYLFVIVMVRDTECELVVVR